MAGFVKGDIVILPFPFSDLTQAKRRPAVVVANIKGNDLILCQITSQTVSDEYAVRIDSSDFSTGGLNQISNIRPNRLFTADKSIILYKAGELRDFQLKNNQSLWLAGGAGGAGEAGGEKSDKRIRRMD